MIDMNVVNRPSFIIHQHYCTCIYPKIESRRSDSKYYVVVEVMIKPSILTVQCGQSVILTVQCGESIIASVILTSHIAYDLCRDTFIPRFTTRSLMADDPTIISTNI